MPRWAVLSATCAPLLLIGGWQLAAGRQPGGFDPVRQTISALAARGATDRWIMTAGLAGVGVCHVITALGLRPVAVPGRLLLAIGGVATVSLAALPQPVTGDSTAHVAAAAIVFPALSLWPALAAWPLVSGKQGYNTVSHSRVMLAAAAGLLGLLGWFGFEVLCDGPRIGLSERVLTGAQALCPLAAVLLIRRR